MNTSQPFSLRRSPHLGRKCHESCCTIPPKPLQHERPQTNPPPVCLHHLFCSSVSLFVKHIRIYHTSDLCGWMPEAETLCKENTLDLWKELQSPACVMCWHFFLTQRRLSSKKPGSHYKSMRHFKTQFMQKHVITSSPFNDWILIRSSG